MRGEISWSKKLFSSTYELRNYRGKKGELTMEIMSGNATGSISGRRYRFRSTGLLSNVYEMICTETDALVAKIKFNSWKQKAKIITEDRQYYWKHKNFWQTKWSVFDDRREYVNCYNNSFVYGGDIVFHPSAEHMVLAGLFIKNRFVRRNSGA